MQSGNLSQWRDTGDSYRITTDINNSAPGDGTSTIISWFAVQRAVEAMRIYISLLIEDGRPLKGHPDLDNVSIGNRNFLNQLSEAQRRTYFSFWIVTGVPIYLGDDLNLLDPAFLSQLTNKEVNDIHSDWTSTISPAVFVNPNDGSRNPSQGQIWVAGPFGDTDEVIVMLANMDCTQEDNHFPVPWQCEKNNGETLNVVATFDKLQLQGSYCNRDVWAGQDTGRADTQISRELGAGESVIFRLTPVAKAPGLC